MVVIDAGAAELFLAPDTAEIVTFAKKANISCMMELKASLNQMDLCHIHNATSKFEIMIPRSSLK